MELRYPEPPLADRLVTLRPWGAEGDLDAVRAASRDPLVPAGTTVPPSCSPAEGRAWLERQQDRQTAGTGISLAIAAEDGAAVGMVGITGVDPRRRSGHLGYWVVPARRGRGYARRAVGLLLDWALRGMGLVRVEARVAVDNAASRHIIEASGMTFEAMAPASMRLGDAWVDMAVYALTRR